MRELLEQIKKTVVFLGTIGQERKIRLHATAFLVSIENVFHLVTAKHVVVDPETGQWHDDGMHVFFNSKRGGIQSRAVAKVKDQHGVSWVFHRRDEVDIAMLPFGLEPEFDDVKTVQDALFLSADKLFELYDVFFLSYQPGIELGGRVSPVIRSGTISRLNEDGTFYVDAAAFPGNSGSPVFLKPSPIRFGSKGIAIGGDKLGGKFVGVIGEYLPYREVAISVQTRRPRVFFEENTGLSKVWPVGFIKGIMDSEGFRAQLRKITQG